MKTAHTPAGLGATITPAMAAAFGGLPPAVMGQATSAVNVVHRVAGALGSALLAVILLPGRPTAPGKSHEKGKHHD